MSHSTRLPEKVEHVVALLKDENWCTSYVSHLRWPEGFTCPVCGRYHPDIKTDKNPTCLDCGKSSSLTAGTLMHGSKKNISDWLQAIWWLCGSTEKQNIKDLQQLLRLGSYQTAWTWMQKLRCAMHLLEQQKCRGELEIDYSVLPQLIDDSSIYIVAVIEIRLTDWSTGRIKMAAFDRLTPEAIEQFLKDSVSAGSVVFAPDKEPFRSVKTLDCLYSIESGKKFHENLRGIHAHFYNWYTRKHHRRASLTLLQKDLIEFSFHINSKLSITRQLLFENLLRAIIRHTPVPCHALAEQSYPARGVV